MYYNPIPFQEDNNINAPLQKGNREAGWSTYYNITCINDSIIFLNVDECTLCDKGNACEIIAKPVIEITLEKDYIHTLNGMSEKYMYRYLYSKLLN